METLPMFDGDANYDSVLSDAINGEGAFQPGGRVIPEQEQEIPATLALGEELEDIPPTQPDNTPSKADGEDLKEREGTLGEQVLAGQMEDTEQSTPNGAEITGDREKPEETPVTPAKPDKGEQKDFPMMTREQQQTFKDAKGKVAKMDQANQVPDNKRAPALKRPAAQNKATENKAGKKSKASGMAQPVETVEAVDIDDNESHDECTPRNLENEFHEVAESQHEAPPATAKCKALPKRRAARAKASPKVRPTAKATAKAKAKAKSSPQPKRKSTKGNRGQKDEEGSTEKATRKTSKLPSKENTPEAEEKGGEGDSPQGKKTFAGRRCPKSGDAKLRFECLRDVFTASILPLVSQQASALEAWCSCQATKRILKIRGIMGN